MPDNQLQSMSFMDYIKSKQQLKDLVEGGGRTKTNHVFDKYVKFKIVMEDGTIEEIKISPSVEMVVEWVQIAQDEQIASTITITNTKTNENFCGQSPMPAQKLRKWLSTHQHTPT